MMPDDVTRLFEVEKKLEKKGKDPQPIYLQCLCHDSHKLLVSAR